MLAVANIWYALPLIVSLTLVTAATRHELFVPIFVHAAKFAAWLLAFMGAFLGVLALLERIA